MNNFKKSWQLHLPFTLQHRQPTMQSSGSTGAVAEVRTKPHPSTLLFTASWQRQPRSGVRGGKVCD